MLKYFFTYPRIIELSSDQAFQLKKLLSTSVTLNSTTPKLEAQDLSEQLFFLLATTKMENSNYIQLILLETMQDGKLQLLEATTLPLTHS